jgi:NB-ARC domain
MLNPPTNLPYSGSKTFVGRDLQLQQLHEYLQQDQPVSISAIAGMGGAGKTELAIQYALRYKIEYPGGLCWLNVKGAKPDEVGNQIIKYYLKYLKSKSNTDSEDKKLSLSDRVQKYFSNWCPGLTLLIFDDVNDYAQVKPWIPPAPSQFKILITTRVLNLAQSIQRLDLDILALADALKLLRNWAGEKRMYRAEKEASALCEWLGRLPLGLELVGRYLERKPDISITEMLRRLKAKRLEQQAIKSASRDMTALLGVGDAFELSWQEMPPLAKDLGCFLSIFSLVPIPWTTISRFYSDKDFEELEDARDDSLLNFHLIQHKSDGMYGLHELIREFFQSKIVLDNQSVDLVKFTLEKLISLSSKDFQCVFSLISNGFLDYDFLDKDNPLPSSLELGNQLYKAKAACYKGLGELANQIFTVKENGELPGLGIRLHSSQSSNQRIYLNTGWYFGHEMDSDVIELPQEFERCLSNDEEERNKAPKFWELGWNNLKGAPINYQPSWPWKWIYTDLFDALSKLLNQRILPVESGALSLEAAWHGLILLMRGNSPACFYHPSYDPVPLEIIEHNFQIHSNSSYPWGISHCLNQLKIEVESAKLSGQKTIAFPRSFLDFKLYGNFSDEKLLAYTSPIQI